MSEYVDIYIQHEDGTFKNHLWDNHDYYDGPITMCKIAANTLAKPYPDDPSQWDLMYYFEHERDDVIPCWICMAVFTDRFTKMDIRQFSRT